jgi:rubrerythrin
VFDAIGGDESGHRRRLIELYRQKFGEHIALIRRQDVKGFVPQKPAWLVRPLGLEAIRRQVSAIEVETRQFYEKAAIRAQTWVRHRYMETPITSAATQVALGGALVFGTGVLIGSS